MPNGFSLKEAAAIAELRESTVRTAIEKKDIAPDRAANGKAERLKFNVRDLFYVKLLSDFPLNLDRDDKRALHDIVFRRAGSSGRWSAERWVFSLTSGSIVIHVEVKPLRDKLARTLASFHRGRRRVVSNPGILSGEPIFEGTRIPLSHVAALIAKGEGRSEILEDYPALNERDLDYAAIHAKMKPHPGRPRKQIEMHRR